MIAGDLCERKDSSFTAADVWLMSVGSAYFEEAAPVPLVCPESKDMAFDLWEFRTSPWSGRNPERWSVAERTRPSRSSGSAENLDLDTRVLLDTRWRGGRR
jgi:hypothetical protein